MPKCPHCGADYEIGDATCPRCEEVLPDPYDQWSPGDDESDGYDTGDFPNPRRTTPPEEQQAGLVSVATVAPAEARDVSGQLSAAGIRHTLYPAPGMPNFLDMANEIGGVHVLVVQEDAPAAWQLLEKARLAPEALTILSGAEVIMGETTFNPGTLVLAEGRVLEILNFAMPNPENGATYYDLSDMIVSAGFIDLHTHGMMGIDTNAASMDDFLRWSAEAARFGITALAPTAVACPPQELRQILEGLSSARQEDSAGARLLGLHFESNFINPTCKGAQPPAYLVTPEDPLASEVLGVLEAYADDVLRVTLAPELPGAEACITWLGAHGIQASMGHSAASYEDAIAGIEAGATSVTHLFNAMAPLHHRNPGLIGAALERDEVYTEMVCDGVHVHPAVISFTISAKGAERFLPVSDSLSAAGMGDGEYTLGGNRVIVRNGEARLPDGTLAGSITTMDAIMRYLVEEIGWDLGEALSMCSTTPADAIGRDDLGRIVQGGPADLVVLDQNLQVRMTLVAGKPVYQA